ncbi:HTH-type transcriptional activator RhaR [bioreactor metagenome]|uniref:HTH-type transcriptional activator RhaR n=1 Tax=bioreactor metagenome TaxID=1076179 RepID=A0A645A6J9_9ZZZZ
MITQSYVASHLTEQNSYQRTLHFHDINEILFSLNSECSFFLGSNSFKISRGIMILIPEGTIHRKFNPSNMIVDTYTIHYPTSLLSAYSTPNTNLMRIYGSNAACVQLPDDKIELATRLFEGCLVSDDSSFGCDLRRNMRLLDILLEFYPYFDDGAKHTVSKSEESPFVADLIQYIQSHLTEHMSLDQLANEFFTSKYNLCRIFKKETGFTIVEYINSNRIRLACSILREEKQGYDVGNRVGFSNRSHFIRTFQQLTGTTPGGYAKQYRGYTNAPVFSNFTPHRDNS